MPILVQTHYCVEHQFENNPRPEIALVHYIVTLIILYGRYSHFFILEYVVVVMKNFEQDRVPCKRLWPNLQDGKRSEMLGAWYLLLLATRASYRTRLLMLAIPFHNNEDRLV